MQECEFCKRARELSKDINGHSKVMFCRTCYRRNRRQDALKKERSESKKK